MGAEDAGGGRDEPWGADDWGGLNEPVDFDDLDDRDGSSSSSSSLGLIDGIRDFLSGMILFGVGRCG